MIDKLDLRVPGPIPFTESFGRLYTDLSRDLKRWKESKHYAASAAFDDCGLDVLLHMHCRMTTKDMHKIEILRTGDKSYADMVALCGRVFDCDPEKLGIMRVDLTADVEDVPVDWFKRHVLVKSKQTRRELGQTYMTIRKGRAETLYAGVKPNQIRIYDKVAERRMQYGKYLTRHALMVAQSPELSNEEPSTFESLYGHAPDATITRVERQVGGKDVEKIGLVEMRDLRRSDRIMPFEKLMFFDTQMFDQDIEDWGMVNWGFGQFLQQRVREFGVSDTLAWMKGQTGKNFDRAKKHWAPFLRITDNVVGIDSMRLNRLYQYSSSRQLARLAA